MKNFYDALGQIPERIPAWPQPQVLNPIMEESHHSGPPSMMDKLTGILVKVNMIPTSCNHGMSEHKEIIVSARARHQGKSWRWRSVACSQSAHCIMIMAAYYWLIADQQMG